MTYKFESYGEVEMANHQINIHEIHDNFNGLAKVYILISLGSPQANASKIVVFLGNYTYTGDQALKAEVESWVTTKLTEYEV